MQIQATIDARPDAYANPVNSYVVLRLGDINVFVPPNEASMLVRDIQRALDRIESRQVVKVEPAPF